jgi:hypothetical protein
MRRITLPVALAISLGIIVLMVAALYAMGRPPICKCGYVLFWGRSPDSQHLFDAYTFTHMLHAPLFYLLIWLVDRGRLSVAKRLVLCVFLEAGWELIENTPFIITRYQAGDPTNYLGDSIVNSVGDVLAMMTGFAITALMPVWWGTAILFVATEVILYLTMQDGFVLDFLTLVLGRRPF